MRFIAPLAAAAVVALCASGCAPSLRDRVQETVRIGDQYADVKDALGTPRDITIVQEPKHSVVMEYADDDDDCKVFLENDLVTDVSCKDMPSGPNKALLFVAALLKGMGDGMTRASQDRVECKDRDGTGQHYSCTQSARTYDCMRVGNSIECR